MAGRESLQANGDGWAAGPGGARMWGRYGAAGLFLLAQDGTHPVVLMQHRAAWTNFGDTWGIPGGARDLHESVEEAAVRETVEECAIDPQHIEVVGSEVTSGPFEAAAGLPGGWTYTTVIARTKHEKTLSTTANEESYELRWVPVAELENLPLIAPFRQALPRIREMIEPLI
ncbi:NUDIX domain-containing protein [Corynebacterium ammoniagenes]|uniref:NTP pyrophosphohydrolase n=2 Tax=Corynebacterium ammoniagenes TaxID=1697 RepID=A0AAV5G769_CORAM|nr:NUDIX hydrolase [Corynebacterium ammoniagenes]APT83477.1 NTP pyrophosphohydrolase [Corynebacterium ammoniagenes DSM 20306]AQS74479.1 NTP pyrophosphohydrolase [Corynebacterium ammoniagenes]NMF32133.1 NUDIX hydrolase [Corynebacterium ammoniagenes]GJN43157.1 NTP pyrophosphohydrolase [Corynebacterium ammoniagenes]